MEIRIPKLGVAMTEGTVAQWLVDDGAAVTAGEPLYILETDKVENEIESPSTGVIRIVGTPGEAYDVGTLIATIDSE
jgi:pyruvate/2-oxoglutarate dehydrogenase complex dihydrolipoamide acyltransferase (E2) component